MIRLPSVGVMSGHRLRRWPNINPTLSCSLTSAGLLLGQRRGRWPNNKPALGEHLLLHRDFTDPGQNMDPGVQMAVTGHMSYHGVSGDDSHDTRQSGDRDSHGAWQHTEQTPDSHVHPLLPFKAKRQYLLTCHVNRYPFWLLAAPYLRNTAHVCDSLSVCSSSSHQYVRRKSSLLSMVHTWPRIFLDLSTL